MQTTLVRDSIVGDDWIRQMMAMNPPAPCFDKEGKPNGNYTSGLVRLSFTEAVFEKKPGMRNDPSSVEKHGVTLLWVPGQDLSVLYQPLFDCVAKEFPGATWNAYLQPPWFDGLRNPFRQQAEKTKYAGYTPGGVFTAASSQYQPIVQDHLGNVIVNPAQVHGGVWAICVVNAYPSGKKANVNKGPRFGIQAIMVVADDTNLAVGGAVDAKQAFAGVKVQAPVAVPPSAFGQAPVPTGMSPQGVGAYYPPSAPQAPGYMPAPGYGAPPPAPGYGAPPPAPGYGAPPPLPSPGYGAPPPAPGYGAPPPAPGYGGLPSIPGGQPGGYDPTRRYGG